MRTDWVTGPETVVALSTRTWGASKVGTTLADDWFLWDAAVEVTIKKMARWTHRGTVYLAPDSEQATWMFNDEERLVKWAKLLDDRYDELEYSTPPKRGVGHFDLTMKVVGIAGRGLVDVDEHVHVKFTHALDVVFGKEYRL